MTRSVAIQIEPVPAVSRPAALRFLLEQTGPLARFGADSDYAAAQPPCAAEFLIWARCGNRILSVFWGVPTARGRLLHVTLPRCAAEAPADLRDRMLRDLLHRMRQDQRARGAQTIIRPDATELQRAARRIGFRQVASLAWYACVPQSGGTSSGKVRLVRYERSARAELLAVLERTYVDSADCPSLAGWLEPADYLTEYESRSADAARAWYFVRFDEATIGCLLCGSADPGLVELTYWGLVPEARGHRLGNHVLRLMHDQVARSAQLIVTCADEGNLAACCALQRTGFEVVDRQQLHICPLSAGSSALVPSSLRER